MDITMQTISLKLWKEISEFINDRYKGLRTTRSNRDLCKELLSKVLYPYIFSYVPG